MLKVFVLFVCMGNTCRSPMAEGYFNKLLAENNYERLVYVDSAGTHSSREGQAPNSYAMKIAEKEHFNIAHLRSRTVDLSDAKQFDYIVVMDRENMDAVKAKLPLKYHHKIHLLLDFVDESGYEIKDPYERGEEEYARAYNLIRSGVDGFFDYMEKKYKL